MSQAQPAQRMPSTVRVTAVGEGGVRARLPGSAPVWSSSSELPSSPRRSQGRLDFGDAPCFQLGAVADIADVPIVPDGSAPAVGEGEPIESA